MAMLKHLLSPFVRFVAALTQCVWNEDDWYQTPWKRQRQDDQDEQTWQDRSDNRASSSSSWNRHSDNQRSWNESPAACPAPPSAPRHHDEAQFHDKPNDVVLPTRSTNVEQNVPTSFRPTSLYLDETPKYDTPLARRVFSTDYSQTAGIAGMPIEKVPLIKVLYSGVNNWCLRPLSLGKMCYFVLVRSYQASVFIYAISKELRTIDIEHHANGWNKAKASPLPSSNDEEKRKILSEYGRSIALQVTSPNSGDEALIKRVQELEIEVAKHRTDANTKFTPGQIKHLRTDCPKQKSTREINAWLNRIVSKQDQKRIAKLVTELQSTFSDDETVALEEAKFHLVLWGMPVARAAEFEYDNACKVVVACTLI